MDERILTAINNAYLNDSDLFARMDKHQKLIDNEFEALTKWDNTEIVDIFQVVVPEARLFFNKICAMIAGANVVPEVEGDIPDDEAALIVDFAKDAEIEATNLWMLVNDYPLHNSNVEQINGQGWACRQIMWRMEDGILIPDTRAIERRRLVYGASRSGLEWACVISRRSKYDIQKDYGFTISNEYGVVRDVWTKDENAVFISDEITDTLDALSGKKGPEQVNPYGFVPFVIQAAPVGSTLGGKTEHRGESIFYDMEDVFKEINFNASVTKTQGFEDLRPALQQPGDKNAEVPDHYPSSQGVLSVDQEMKLIPKRDLTVAQKTFQGIINDFFQRAGLTSINYGNVAFPLPAVAIARLMATKDSILYPRLQALALLYQNSHKMIVKQLEGMTKVTLGTEGMERTYDVKKLTGAYKMKYRFKNESLEEMATKMAIGNSAIGLLSKQTIRKDILGIENNEKEDDLMEQEAAETITPENVIISQIMSYAEMQTEEANLHVLALLKRLKQHFGGENPLQANMGVRPNQQLPIFGGGQNG